MSKNSQESENIIDINPHWKAGRRGLLRAAGLGVGTLAVIGFTGKPDLLPTEIVDADSSSGFINLDIGTEALEVSQETINGANELAKLLKLSDRGTSAVVISSKSPRFILDNENFVCNKSKAFVDGYGSPNQTIILSNSELIDYRTFAHETGHTVCPFDNSTVSKEIPQIASHTQKAFRSQYEASKSQIKPIGGDQRFGYPHFTETEMNIFQFGMEKIGKLTWYVFADTNNTVIDASMLTSIKKNVGEESISGVASSWVISEFDRLRQEDTRHQDPYMDYLHWGMFVSQVINNPKIYSHLKGYGELVQYADQIRDIDRITFYDYAREGFAELFATCIVGSQKAIKTYPRELLDDFISLFDYLQV